MMTAFFLLDHEHFIMFWEGLVPSNCTNAEHVLVLLALNIFKRN